MAIAKVGGSIGSEPLPVMVADDTEVRLNVDVGIKEKDHYAWNEKGCCSQHEDRSDREMVEALAQRPDMKKPDHSEAQAISRCLAELMQIIDPERKVIAPTKEEQEKIDVMEEIKKL